MTVNELIQELIIHRDEFGRGDHLVSLRPIGNTKRHEYGVGFVAAMSEDWTPETVGIWMGALTHGG